MDGISGGMSMMIDTCNQSGSRDPIISASLDLVGTG